MAKTTEIKMYIPQGTTYIHSFAYNDVDGVPIDLSGFAARMQFRKSVSTTETLYDVDDQTGELVTDATGVTLTIPAVASELFAFTTCVFDIEIEAPGGQVTRIVQGSVVVDPEVTR